MACEPTISLHHIEPLSQEDSVRNILFLPAMSYPCERTMRVRGALLAGFFPNLGEATKSVVSVELLSEIWGMHQRASLYLYGDEGFSQEWLTKVEDVWSSTESVLMAKTESKARQIARKTGEANALFFQTRTPRMAGAEKATQRRFTKRTRERLNPVPRDDNLGPESLRIEEQEPAEANEIQPQILVSQKSLNVVQALYSNIQVHAQSIRWRSFCNFTIEVGCTITLSGGASTKFV